MKGLLRIFAKDILKEKFTVDEIVIFGVIIPLGLFAACLLADLLNR